MSKPIPQIVTLGGGGFSMEPNNPMLDDYALRLTRRKTPRVCYLPTAGGDNADYTNRFYAAFRWPRAVASHISLFNRDAEPLRERLLSQDLIYVGGGNTANLLAVLRTHGVDRILHDAWRRGIVLTGISAGMLCWFKGGATDSFGPLGALNDGLSFLPFTACPHYDEEYRRPTYHDLIKRGVLAGGYAADNGAAIHFVGKKLFACVCSRPAAAAYRVERRAGRIVETPLSTRFLGDRRTK